MTPVPVTSALYWSYEYMRLGLSLECGDIGDNGGDGGNISGARGSGGNTRDCAEGGGRRRGGGGDGGRDGRVGAARGMGGSSRALFCCTICIFSRSVSGLGASAFFFLDSEFM